jgi:hypothetical protein
MISRSGKKPEISFRAFYIALGYILLLILVNNTLSQFEKGSGTTTTEDLRFFPITKAVIIGISEYSK